MAHPEFGEAYARAGEIQAQAVAEAGHAEAMKAGSTLDPAAARVRWGAARRMAGRLAPKRGLRGEVFDPYSPGHVGSVQPGAPGRTVYRSMMRMHCGFMTARGMLWVGESP